MFFWAPPQNTRQNDVWELHHVADGFSMPTDLSPVLPEKLNELQEVFLSEAVNYKVLPIDDRRQLHLNAQLLGWSKTKPMTKNSIAFALRPKSDSQTKPLG